MHVLVMVWWVLTMISGLWWARGWTALFTAVTLGMWLWTQGASPAEGPRWLQGVVLAATPAVLAWHRQRAKRILTHLHADEAKRMARLSESARSVLSLQHATQQMDAQIAEITDLYHVTKETARALHPSELFAACLTIAPRLLDARGIRLVDLSGSTPQALRATRSADGRLIAATNGQTEPAGHPSSLLEVEQAVIDRVLASGGASSATGEELACAMPEGITRVSWAPLWQEQQPIGVLIADDLAPANLKTLSIVANQLSLQFSRILLYAQVEALAVTDALTGVSVRHHFMDRATEEVARSTRHDLACSVLMIDLDFFKQKNDTYGHLVGDVVLREVAGLLKRNLREVDLIARYGGEEFILLLIETDLRQAMPIAQRLKQLVEVHPIRAYDETLTQTISIGVAGFPAHGTTVQTLIERADEALYAAKRAGRNQVVLWSRELATEPSGAA